MHKCYPEPTSTVVLIVKLFSMHTHALGNTLSRLKPKLVLKSMPFIGVVEWLSWLLHGKEVTGSILAPVAL